MDTRTMNMAVSVQVVNGQQTIDVHNNRGGYHVAIVIT